MAGHSKFKNIMHRKGAQDKKRAAAFSKLSREITVAAKSGLPDPAMNAAAARRGARRPRRRSCPRTISSARSTRPARRDAETYEEIRYEGFGPGGVSLIIEALTDNRNRTATNVRTAVTKNGGNLGAIGSVSHAFDRMGLIEYPAKAGDPDKVFEAALDAGARTSARPRTATKSGPTRATSTKSPRRSSPSSASPKAPSSPGARKSPSTSTNPTPRPCSS